MRTNFLPMLLGGIITVGLGTGVFAAMHTAPVNAAINLNTNVSLTPTCKEQVVTTMNVNPGTEENGDGGNDTVGIDTHCRLMAALHHSSGNAGYTTSGGNLPLVTEGQDLTPNNVQDYPTFGKCQIVVKDDTSDGFPDISLPLGKGKGTMLYVNNGYGRFSAGSYQAQEPYTCVAQ